MTSQLVLLKAIRSGRLAQVRAALDAGAPLDEAGEQGGEPGLAMGIACFLGHVDIVRELAGHGAQVDLPDNRTPTSPLSMAVRGGHAEVVRALIELGARVPEGMATGLSEHDIMVAKWKADRDGHGQNAQAQAAVPEIEEIVMVGCSNTDTQVLEAEVLRRAAQKAG